MRNIISALSALLLSIIVTTASAHEIKVDVGDYEGIYKIKGPTNGENSDVQPIASNRFELNEGAYKFYISPGVETKFTVDPQGRVSSGNTVALSESGSTLKIETVELTVKKGAYQGSYFIPGVHKSRINEQVRTINIPPTLGNYQIAFDSSNSFRFTIDDNGKVTPEVPETADDQPYTLNFKTVDFKIQVGNYGGRWSIVGAREAKLEGDAVVKLVPGVRNYTFAFASSNNFRFSLLGDGNADLSDTRAAEPSGTEKGMDLNTVDVFIDAGRYNGTWRIDGLMKSDESFKGSTKVSLVPDVQGYKFAFGPSNDFLFDLDETGLIDASKTMAAESTSDGLRLNTTSVRIEPREYAGSWSIVGAVSKEPFIGPVSIDLVPDVMGYNFQFASSNGFSFNIDENGVVDAASTTAAIQTSSGGLGLESTYILVSPSDLSTKWSVEKAESRQKVAGSRAVALVPNVQRWQLNVADGGKRRFDTDSDGEPTPSSIVVPVNGSDVTFKLTRGERYSRCNFQTELVMQSDHHQIGVGDIVDVEADIDVDLNDLAEEPERGVYFWEGEITFSKRGESEKIASTKGRIHFESRERDDLAFIVAERIAGTFGGKTLKPYGNLVSIEMFGAPDILYDGTFVREISTWNKLEARRQTFLELSEQQSSAGLGSISGMNCSDVIK